MTKATNQITKLHQGRQALVAAARSFSGRNYHSLVASLHAFRSEDVDGIGQAEFSRLVAEAVQSVRPARGIRFNFSAPRAA